MCLSFFSSDSLRRFDLFGSKVGVTYNSEYSHRTGLGGFISVIFAIFFGSSVLLSLVEVLLNKDYTVKDTVSYS